MTNIKETFNTWLTQTNDTLTTASTASEYTGRLNRLSLRLYGKTDWSQLANDIYILRLLFADSRNWIHISDEDLYHITIYLHNYKNQNRNFNDNYNRFFHSLRKQLNLPLSTSVKNPSFFFNMFRNSDEYLSLAAWIKHIFVTEKSLTYLSWLYINNAEKRKTATALLKFSTFIIGTQTVSTNIAGLLSKKILWLKKKSNSNNHISPVEASGVEGRNFYSRYKDGKVEKLLLIKEAAQALGCGESTIRRLLKKGKLNFKPETNRIIAENVRRFLKRRHSKRTGGVITAVDEEKKKENWVKMKKAEEISGYSATYIRTQVKQGRVAYTRYGLKKFLYFKPDLIKLRH